MPETFDIKAIEKRMDGAIASLKTEFSGLRTGRASIHLLDSITVMAYGAPTPLNQVASVTASDARMLSVSVWDKSVVGATDRAIREAPLGLNPITDGQTLRIPIPPLSEERRKDLQKLAGPVCRKRPCCRPQRPSRWYGAYQAHREGQRHERGPGQGPVE